MDVEDGIQMIKQAFDKQREDRMFELYASIYPNMDKKTFVPFNEFYSPQKPIVVEEKTAEQILLEVKEIMNSNTWR